MCARVASVIAALVAAALAAAPAHAADCALWSLDGYRLGMSRDEILAVRSITLHVEGQAQAVEPGKFSGVLVLESPFGLAKWDVAYQTADATALRAEFQRSFGDPVSDVTGTTIDDATATVRQRRTIWTSTGCDAAVVLYENWSVKGPASRSVHATLARASAFPSGFLRSTTLYP